MREEHPLRPAVRLTAFAVNFKNGILLRTLWRRNAAMEGGADVFTKTLKRFGSARTPRHAKRSEQVTLPHLYGNISLNTFSAQIVFIR